MFIAAAASIPSCISFLLFHLRFFGRRLGYLLQNPLETTQDQRSPAQVCDLSDHVVCPFDAESRWELDLRKDCKQSRPRLTEIEDVQQGFLRQGHPYMLFASLFIPEEEAAWDMMNRNRCNWSPVSSRARQRDAVDDFGDL